MNWAALNWPARQPLRSIVIAAAVAGLSLFSASRLRFNASLESLFSPRDPAARALSRVLHDFPTAENMLLLATASGDRPQPDALLAFADRLERAVKNDPVARTLVSSLSCRPDADSREFVKKVVVPNGVLYLSDAEFAAARKRLTPGEMARQLNQDAALLAAPGPAAALARATLQDPLRLHEFIQARLAASRPIKTYQNRDAFLSEDGRSLLITIAGNLPPSDLKFCRQISSALESIAQQVNQDHFKLDFSGAYPIAALSERSIRSDSISSVIGSVACLLGLFVVSFRRPLRFFAVTFAPVPLGVVLGFGIYALFEPDVTPLTAVIGSVLAGVGIDYGVFFLLHYLERRQAGAAPATAAQQTISTIGGALVAAWLTSIVGFVAVGFSSVRLLRDFSVAGSLSLAGALLGAVFLLPALLVLLDHRARSVAGGLPGRALRTIVPFIAKAVRGTDPAPEAQPRSDDANRPAARPAAATRLPVEPLVGWIDHHARLCLAIAAVLMLGLLSVLSAKGWRLELESDPAVLHPHPNPPLDAEKEISGRMGGAGDSMIVYLQASDAPALLTLAHRVNEKLQSPAARQAGVGSTYGLASLLPDPATAQVRLRQVGPAVAQQVMADFDAAVGASPFKPGSMASYRSFLHTLLTPTSPPGIDQLASYPQLAGTLLPRNTPDGATPVEAITLVFLKPAAAQRSADAATANVLRAMLRGLPGATLTGMTVLSLDTQQTIQRDLPRFILVAIAVIAAYLLLHFRSVTLGLLAVLPSVCSLAFLVAVAKMAGAKMNLANIVSIPLLIGIDIDYGIFLVSAAGRCASREQLLRRVVPSGQAVAICGAATVLGFGSLAFTSVPAVRSLGWAVAIGVTTCALSALFVLLPLLLIIADRRTRAKRTHEPPVVTLGVIVLLLAAAGCATPAGALSFPSHWTRKDANAEWYDICRTGRPRFGVGFDESGRAARLLYDDSGSGRVDREYRLADYADQRVPHLILLLDSIPFATMAERYAAGDFRWFDPPQKMIAPFPSLTEICYSDVLRAPPLPGVIDQYFDPRDEERKGILWDRVRGYEQPWERRLHYHANYLQQGLSFLHPRQWYAAELEQARRTLDASPDRVTIIYIASAASMVCKYGRPGAEEVLDGARQLCLQLLYERRGAIKITMMADHGHNYMSSKNVSLEDILKAAGFHPADKIRNEKDCVIEINALVTCAGVHTRQPARVAAALCERGEIELAIYIDGPRVIIRSRQGAAAIECRDGRLRYLSLTADVLGYGELMRQLRAAGLMNADGFASDDVWFARTLDHPWPNAPRRVWDALHGRFINPPTVLLSIRDGYYAGDPSFERYIKMASTHGGLNQVNSATFAITMTGRLKQAVRHEDVLATVEPGFEPRVQR